MSVQARQDNTNKTLIKSGETYVRNADIKQNAGRTTPLLPYTVMALNATSRLWVPFTSLVATNGESVPRGIYMGDTILAADLVAGNVEDKPILMGGCCTIDENMIVWDDDTLNEDSIVNPTNIEARTAREALAQASGIFFEDTIDISEFEN
jgi:hypothetical protein